MEVIFFVGTAANDTVIASSRAPVGAKACTATQLNKWRSNRMSLILKSLCESVFNWIAAPGLASFGSTPLAMTGPSGDASLKLKKKFTLIPLLMLTLLALPAFAKNIAPRPQGCQAKRTDDKFSASAGLIFTVLAPEISVLKFDFLGAALAYSTQYGMAYTKPFLKKHFDRRRPCGCDGAFPSGHMMKYGAGASYLHYRYGWQWGFPAYALAILFSADRVRMQAHSWRDIFATLAVVNLAEFILIPRFNKDVRYLPSFSKDDGKPKVVKGKTTAAFYPMISPEKKGLSLGLRVRM